MRTLAAGAITALSAAEVAAVILVEMAFSPVLYLASSASSIAWNGNTYLGAGPLGAVEAVRDSSGDPAALQFSLSGVPQDSIALALGQSARNKTCIVRLAILNGTTHAIEDVSLVGTFLLDQLTISGGLISVTAHPMARVFQRPKAIRYTAGDQQLVSAGDRSLEFLVSQANHQDIWPAAAWFRK